LDTVGWVKRWVSHTHTHITLYFNGHFSWQNWVSRPFASSFLLLHLFLDCASFWDRPKFSTSFLTQSHQVFFGRPLCLIPRHTTFDPVIIIFSFNMSKLIVMSSSHCEKKQGYQVSKISCLTNSQFRFSFRDLWGTGLTPGISRKKTGQFNIRQ